MTDNPTPSNTTTAPSTAQPPLPLPRIAIQFCTQCKWMLRAAYFAQELLSTFSTSLGEVALQPSTGGTFTVTITTANADTALQDPRFETRTLWDRKTDGGFPETKELKRRVRDVIDPARDLGHVDRDHARPAAAAAEAMPSSSPAAGSSNDASAQAGGALDDAARARIAGARTNKGQAAPSAVDGAALMGELKGGGPNTAQAQASQGRQAGGGKEPACEDCA